jgi:hypothetical protein
MKHYIVYFINGSHKYLQSSLDLMENLDRLKLVGIEYEVVDYIVPLEKHIDQSILEHRKFLPDGNSIWKKENLIDKKVKEITAKRNTLLQKLDIDFIISLETPSNKQTEVIKNNKKFLRDLSCRTEMHHIHDCEKIHKFNAFYNIVDIQIIDPGYGCSESVPCVTISPPEETEFNYGLTASAHAIRGSKGELLSITMEKLGSGYISDPEIKISGYEAENAKHPIVKAVIGNIM